MADLPQKEENWDAGEVRKWLNMGKGSSRSHTIKKTWGRTLLPSIHAWSKCVIAFYSSWKTKRAFSAAISYFFAIQMRRFCCWGGSRFSRAKSVPFRKKLDSTDNIRLREMKKRGNRRNETVRRINGKYHLCLGTRPKKTNQSVLF